MVTTEQAISPEPMQQEAIVPRMFRIFSELEKTAANNNYAMNNIDIRNMTRLIREGKSFIKELNKRMVTQNVDLAVAHSKYLKQIKDYKKLKRSASKSKALLKQKRAEILKSGIKIQLLKNKVQKTWQYEDLYKDFVQIVEDAGSPQQADLYIGMMEDEQNKLMGNPPDNENPVALKRLIRFLEKKEKEAKAKEEFAKSKKSGVVKRITSPKASLPLQILSAYIPNDLEAWIHEGIDSEQIREAIRYAKEKHDYAYQKIVEAQDVSARLIFMNKINLLDEMIRYSETSKHNFDRRLNFSSTMHTASTVFSLLSSLIAGGLMFVPGANLVAEGIRKTFEFLGYSSLVAAHTSDPNASQEVQLAARRHYETIKQYNIMETAFAGVGTLTLATAAILPVAATVALPVVVVPILIVAGALTMTISSGISAYSTYKQFSHAKKALAQKLKENPQYNLDKIKERAARGDKTLNNEEKSLLKDAFYKDELWARFKSSTSTAIGSGLVTFLAGAVFVAAIGFPPLGIAIATVMSIAAGVTAVYAAYQKHQEKKLAKAAYKLNEEIQSGKIRTALSSVKPELSSNFKPKIDDSPKSEVEASIPNQDNTNTQVLESTIPTSALNSVERPEKTENSVHKEKASGENIPQTGSLKKYILHQKLLHKLKNKTNQKKQNEESAAALKSSRNGSKNK